MRFVIVWAMCTQVCCARSRVRLEAAAPQQKLAELRVEHVGAQVGLRADEEPPHRLFRPVDEFERVPPLHVKARVGHAVGVRVQFPELPFGSEEHPARLPHRLGLIALLVHRSHLSGAVIADVRRNNLVEHFHGHSSSNRSLPSGLAAHISFTRLKPLSSSLPRPSAKLISQQSDLTDTSRGQRPSWSCTPEEWTE